VVTSVDDDDDDGCETVGAGADIDLDGGGSYLRSAADSILGGAEWTPLLELVERRTEKTVKTESR